MPDFPPAPPIADADKNDIATRAWTRDIATVSAPAGSYGEHVERVQSQIDAPTEGTHTPSLLNTEEDVMSDTPTTPPGESFQEGFIDLNAMVAGDSITIRQYISIVTPVAWRLYASNTYSDAQSNPMLHVVTKPYRYGIRVTLEQTAGTIKSFPYQFFKRRRST